MGDPRGSLFSGGFLNPKIRNAHSCFVHRSHQYTVNIRFAAIFLEKFFIIKLEMWSKVVYKGEKDKQ